MPWGILGKSCKMLEGTWPLVGGILGRLPGGALRLLGEAWPPLGGILGRLPYGDPWGSHANCRRDNCKLLGEFLGSLAMLSGSLGYVPGAISGDLLGEASESSCKLLGEHGHVPWGLLGEICKVLGGAWPNPERIVR